MNSPHNTNNPSAQDNTLSFPSGLQTPVPLYQHEASGYLSGGRAISDISPENTATFATDQTHAEENHSVYAQPWSQSYTSFSSLSPAIHATSGDVFPSQPAPTFRGLGFDADGSLDPPPQRKKTKPVCDHQPIHTNVCLVTPPSAANTIASSMKATNESPRTTTALATTSNGSTRIASHSAELESAPTATARLPPCQMSATELLYFFPHHTQCPKVMLRLLGSGYTVDDMASATLYARGIVDHEAHQRHVNALKREKSAAGKAEFIDPSWTFTKATPGQITVVTNYDVSAYTPRHNKPLHSVKLLDVVQGVKWWPSISDRGIVTQALRFARDNPNLCKDYTTDDIPFIAAYQAYTMPRDALGSNWDAICLRNIRRALESVKARIAKGTL